MVRNRLVVRAVHLLGARALVGLCAAMSITGLGLAGSALAGPVGRPASSLPQLASEPLTLAPPPADGATTGARPELGSEVYDEREVAAEVAAPGTSAWTGAGVGGPPSGPTTGGATGGATGEVGAGVASDRDALHAPLLDALPGGDAERALPSTGPLPPMATDLDPVELEILRLTNALRADPSGPLAREKPLPSCVDQPFYGISVDPATGHPEAAPALRLDERVSVALARPWAREMDRTGAFEHRPPGSALAVYGQLGIDLSATGENIAWFRGYNPTEAARVHFEGWRESDDGHYCALVAPSYTHIGIGTFRGRERSWAVQNFYQLRSEVAP